VPSLSYTINRGKHKRFFQSTPAFLSHHTNTQEEEEEEEEEEEGIHSLITTK
jgi:hypothetical protein